MDVFKIFSLARVPRLWSRSPTFQFLNMVFLKVFKVFTQDRVQQRARSRSLTFHLRTVAGTSKILVSHRFLKKLPVKRFKGFLALFHVGKKCKDWSALGVGTAPRVEPIHAGSSSRPVLGGRVRRHVDVVAFWTLVLALLGPRSFLGRFGMMGTEHDMG